MPVLLHPRADLLDNMQYKTGQEALNLCQRIFPKFNEEKFTDFFGKRNGTRKRILIHLEGGSFDIKQLQVTGNLVSAETST